MRFRWLVPALWFTAIALAAAPPSPSRPGAASKPAAAVRAKPARPVSKLAPPSVPHPTAMFLANWSQEGKRSITFKATAIGTRLFLEDPSGVTVYRFDGSGYLSEAFLAGSNLASAAKRYPAK